MILLDTNIVSVSARPSVEAPVHVWLDKQALETLFICTPVLAELRYGVERLASGKKKDALQDFCKVIELVKFEDRILSFDQRAAHAFGRIRASQERSGHALSPMDAMIAAIALTHDMTLATRNIRDFEGLGLRLVNPFEAAA